MYKNINKYIITGIVFTLIAGTLLHFVYEWSGSNSIVGLFSPVNESIWEHLKLLYYPMTVWVFYGYFKYGKNNPNYFFSALLGLITGLILIPVLYYGFVAVAGTSYLAVDLIIYVIGVVASFLVMGYILKNYNIQSLSVKAGIVLWELFFLLFAIFTIFPPDLPIFQAP